MKPVVSDAEKELRSMCSFFVYGTCSTTSCHEKDKAGRYIIPYRWRGCPVYRVLKELHHLREEPPDIKDVRYERQG